MHIRAIVLALVFVLPAIRSAPAQQPDRVAGWRADIDSLTARIDHNHPNPWAHASRATWMSRARSLRDSVPLLSDGRVLTGLMGLAASIQDGHTTIEDVGRVASNTWFPIRMAIFADGLWVTSISRQFAAAAGKRVISIGNQPANEVVRRLMTITSGDNEFNQRVKSGVLSNGTILNALGVIPRVDTLQLRVSAANGVEQAVKLAATRASGSLDFEQWGELFGPDPLPVVSAFGRVPDSLLEPERNPDLPLHVRGRKAYWWTFDTPSRTLYFQMNNVVAQSRRSKQSLLDTWAGALRATDSVPGGVDRLVLDLRYNSGGDGSLIPAMLRTLIRRDSVIGQRGRFFVLTSGKTFSAAADLVMTLMKFTQPLLVGEPAGAGLNASGDPEHIVLPYSGVRFEVSSHYFQSVTPDNPRSRTILVNIPAPMTGEALFNRRDPAMDAITRAATPYPDVIDVLRASGGAAAAALWRSMQTLYGAISWWEPFRQEDLNNASYGLLEQGRFDDAIAGFMINTERNAKSWEVWDSLGEGYLKAGKKSEALRSYQRALSLAPHNWNAAAQQKIVTQLQAELSTAGH